MARKPTYEELEQRVKELEKEILEHSKANSDSIIEKDFFETILNGIINGVWVTDKEDVIYYTNKGMEIIAGISGDQIVGARVLKDFPESTLKFFKPHYLKAKETLHPVYYDGVLVTTPSGRQSYQSGWLTPRIKDGEFDGMVCTVEDITERKNAEDRLQKANNDLENSVQERTIELSKTNEEMKVEITERKWAEEALREERDKIQKYFDVAGVMLLAMDEDQKVLLMNKKG